MAQITIQDIATLAGVSAATVSRVLHSPHLVSQATLEKIQRIIREKNYVYNAAAADFSRSKSSVVGVFIPTTAGTVFASTVGAIEEYAYEHGFSLMVSNTRYDADIEGGPAAPVPGTPPGRSDPHGLLPGQRRARLVHGRERPPLPGRLGKAA